uniref:EF-hand domain-containing protein n=1 Tax=Oryza barthii TaxID=65489 RepID=A0A0D3HU35_9ORYZ
MGNEHVGVEPNQLTATAKNARAISHYENAGEGGGEGLLPLEPAAGLHKIFLRFDLDGDGSLTKLELDMLLRSLGLGPAAGTRSMPSSPPWSSARSFARSISVRPPGTRSMPSSPERARSISVRPPGTRSMPSSPAWSSARSSAYSASVRQSTVDFNVLASFLTELIVGPCRPTVTLDQAEVAEALRAFDCDGNGFISATELARSIADTVTPTLTASSSFYLTLGPIIH